MDVRGELRRIAELAQLRLTDEELDAMADYIGTAIDRLPVPATTDDVRVVEPERTPRVRADVPGADPLRVPLDAVAPAWRDGFFTVPDPRPDA